MGDDPGLIGLRWEGGKVRNSALDLLISSKWRCEVDA